MKKLGLGSAVGVLMLGLMGCEGLKGHLTVHSPVTLKDKKGKEVVLGANGTRDAEIKIKGEPGRQELEIKTRKDDGKKVTLKIKAPAGVILPESNGEFRMVGNQIGQSVDMAGRLESRRHESPQRSGIEACTRVVRANVCRMEPRRDRNGNVIRDREGREILVNVCRTQDVQANGRREVLSHDVTYTVAGHLSLLEMGTNNAVAHFAGGKSDTYSVIDSKGPCLIH